MTYQEQINHPKWQKKRLEVLKFNKWACKKCGDKEEQLHVHHAFYKKGAMAWEYKKEELECLCSKCHKDLHGIDEAIRKALAVCKDKGLVLAYIEELNSAPANTINPSLKNANARPIAVARTPSDKKYAAVRVLKHFETEKGTFNPGQLLTFPKDKLEEFAGIVEEVESISKAQEEDDLAEMESLYKKYPQYAPRDEDGPEESAKKFFARMKIALGDDV